MPSKLWAVRDAVHGLCVTAAPSGVVVFDGPPPRTTPPKRFVIVGSDGGDVLFGDDVEDGAEVEQVLSDMGNGFRDETGSVLCAACAWSGGTDFGALRVSVKAMVDPIEVAVAADRMLGGAVTAPHVASFSALRVREEQTPKGAVVRAAFTVSYGALITP